MKAACENLAKVPQWFGRRREIALFRKLENTDPRQPVCGGALPSSQALCAEAKGTIKRRSAPDSIRGMPKRVAVFVAYLSKRRQALSRGPLPRRIA